MPNWLELKLKDLDLAVELMRPVYYNLREVVEAGKASEASTRMSKEEIREICNWRRGWQQLYNRLVDKFGLFYLPLGPASQGYTFKTNVLYEIEANTTTLSPDEVNKFLDQLITTTEPRTLDYLQGSHWVSSQRIEKLTKAYALAQRFLQYLGLYALELKTVVEARWAEIEPLQVEEEANAEQA